MSGSKIEEIGGSSRGRYIRNTADIPELSEIARNSNNVVCPCIFPILIETIWKGW
jgi:hypothetical protein